MPKRSNRFQNLIFQIEKAVLEHGWTAKESGEIVENGYVREVDILIEGSVSGHPVKIFIECRDHGRPQNVEWIEALIGKYPNLRPLIAVSRSGFTKQARDKADRNSIQLLTLKEAMNEPWSKRMQIRRHTRHTEVKSFSVKINGVSENVKLDRFSIFSSTDGEVKLPIEEYIFYRLKKDEDEISKLMSENIVLRSEIEDKDEKTHVELTLVPTNSVLYFSETEKYEVGEIKVFIEVSFEKIDLNHEYLEYGASKIILVSSKKDNFNMRFIVKKEVDGDRIIAQVEGGNFKFFDSMTDTVKMNTSLE
jgi:Restriction endonuclease